MKKIRIILLVPLGIFIIGTAAGLAAPYTMIGDQSGTGPVNLILDSFSFNFVQTQTYRVWQYNWIIENPTDITFPNVKLLLPFTWAKIGPDIEAYSWMGDGQEWFNDKQEGLDPSDPFGMWVRVNNVPLDASESNTSSPDSFISMSDTDVPTLSSYSGVSAAVGDNDSLPAWDIIASLRPNETATLTNYIWTERGWNGFWTDPKLVATPVPTSLILLLSGLIGLEVIRRKTKK